MIIDIIISKLNSIVSFLASVTAIYIYYLTLHKEKLKLIEFDYKISLLNGNQIKITLSNNGLKIISIRKIYLILDNAYRFEIYGKEKNLFIDSFKKESIISKPYTDIITNGIKKDLESYIYDTIFKGKFHILVITEKSRKTFYANRNKKYISNGKFKLFRRCFFNFIDYTRKRKVEKFVNQYEDIEVFSFKLKFESKTITIKKNFMYIICISKKEKEVKEVKILVIQKNGIVLDGTIGGMSKLPEETYKNIDDLRMLVDSDYENSKEKPNISIIDIEKDIFNKDK